MLGGRSSCWVYVLSQQVIFLTFLVCGPAIGAFCEPYRGPFLNFMSLGSLSVLEGCRWTLSGPFWATEGSLRRPFGFLMGQTYPKGVVWEVNFGAVGGRRPNLGVRRTSHTKSTFSGVQAYLFRRFLGAIFLHRACLCCRRVQL